MNQILGLDESQWQGGNKDYHQVKAAGYEFTVPRMTYAYPGQGIKIDPTANANYYGAINAGLISGGFHKIGWTDPIAEADKYIDAMSPLSPGDILAYDIEPNSDVQIPANWSEFEQAFVQRIVDRAHTYPWRYLNISMWNSMPAQGIVKNCTPWVAAPSYGWNSPLPVSVTVAVQQGPTTHIPGIPDNVVDTDMWFGTRESLLATTYQPQPAPASATVPVSTPTAANQGGMSEPTQPSSTQTPTAQTQPSQQPTNTPVPETRPAVQPSQATNEAQTPASKTSQTPKVIVPDPAYHFTIWDLISAILRRIWSRL